MNQNDVIRMAQECQLIGMRPHLDGIYQDALQRFATLVAAHEREECAKICDEKSIEHLWEGVYADECAEAIRARNKS